MSPAFRTLAEQIRPNEPRRVFHSFPLYPTARPMIIERAGSPKLVLLTVLGPGFYRGLFYYLLLDIAATRTA